MGRRWAYTLEQRKYKCHRCLCLMGLRKICLNDRCARNGGPVDHLKGRSK